MKLHEIHDHPMAWSMLQRLLDADRVVVLMLRQKDGPPIRYGIILHTEARPSMIADGAFLYRIEYAATRKQHIAFLPKQIQNATIKTIHDAESDEDETCFIVPVASEVD